MKALVLGLGISGKSVVRFLIERGWEVVTVDDKLCPRNDVDVAQFDLFVPSPGIAPTHPLYEAALKKGLSIKGEIQLALEEVTQPCIGVTGTNGKTTVVKMIEHCLKNSIAVGNVGDPLSDHVDKKDQVLVIELSSYQLETMRAKVLDVGLVLNIEEDHLDRYRSFADYAQAKSYIGRCMKEAGTLYVHTSVDPTLFSFPVTPFEGDNAEAAALVCTHFGLTKKEVKDALLSFEKPLHRLEFVATKSDVAYFNDSKATNVSAVIHALQQFDHPVVLLVGGQDKGLDFTHLKKWKQKIKCLIAFGQAREKIANALKDQLDVVVVSDLHAAVNRAKDEKTTVLFSPGCASFDAFKNYAERGETFKQLVRSLE